MNRHPLDPIRQFLIEVEAPIWSCRAKIIAVHHLLDPRTAPSEEVMEAVRQLVSETLNTLDQMKARHSDAFAAAREART